MKKLIAIGAAIIIALAGFGVVATLVARLTARQETYAEMQARLAEQQASADFWRSVAGLVIALVVLVVLVVLALVWSNYSHSRKVELTRLKREYNLFYADERGNYPMWVDREGGEVVRVRPGNTAFAPEYHFVNGAMPQQLPPPGRNRQANNKATLYRNNQQPIAYDVKEIEPLELEAGISMQGQSVNLQQDLQPSEADLPNLQPEISRKFTDLLPQIERYIQEGIGKTETLKALGLGGRYYKDASKVFDEIEASMKKAG